MYNAFTRESRYKSSVTKAEVRRQLEEWQLEYGRLHQIVNGTRKQTIRDELSHRKGPEW